jgi:hypothetical protein
MDSIIHTKVQLEAQLGIEESCFSEALLTHVESLVLRPVGKPLKRKSPTSRVSSCGILRQGLDDEQSWQVCTVHYALPFWLNRYSTRRQLWYVCGKHATGWGTPIHVLTTFSCFPSTENGSEKELCWSPRSYEPHLNRSAQTT